MSPPPEDSSDSTPLTPVRLRYRRQELMLAIGSYLLGRDPSCHVVIDRPLVSRRHARITVEGHRVTVEDLGSLNGVFVNGARVTGLRDLFDGDWITIGSEELELAIGEAGRTRIAVETQADPEAVKPQPSSALELDRVTKSPPQDDRPTERSRTLEILSAIAERAFDSGRIQDAEDMLKLTLLDLLQDASSGQALEPDARDFGVKFGLKLAQNAGSARWFDYVVDLLRAERAPCTEALAKELDAAITVVGSVDVDRLRAYASSLRTLTSNLESLRSSQRVEELVRRAQSRAR
jgi:pSer/pThr/pTyr-binding forkhead associated (FHA) protein